MEALFGSMHAASGARGWLVGWVDAVLTRPFVDVDVFFLLLFGVKVICGDYFFSFYFGLQLFFDIPVRPWSL